MKHRRWLILPCETRARELDAKLLLSVVAAGRGICSVVGSKKAVDLNLDRCPPGVYVGKSVTARSRHSLLLARACGHRLAAWDEEGLVWASRAVYWRTKVHGPTLNTPELLLAWGEENASAWREHPEYAGTPVAVSGNPRTDLLRAQLGGLYREEVACLRRALGRFVLVNTNFSRVNHMQPTQNRHLRWLRENRPDDPRGGFAAHKYRLYEAFLAMLPQLTSRMGEVRFVVRPHPSESLRVWETLARSLPNVRVHRESSIAPWLLAADAVVHNGCTTAVEAFILGCPALAYAPVECDAYDHPLPNGVSVVCKRVDTLAAQLRACGDDREQFFACQRREPARDALMHRNIAGFDAPQLASERICDALSPLLADEAPTRDPSRRGLSAVLLTGRRMSRRLEQHVPGSVNYGPYL
ncbi:MAG: hypothetical protein PVH91_01525, partial [Pseudomonadales bacterium]